MILSQRVDQAASALVELAELLIGGRGRMLELGECMDGLPTHVGV